MRTDNYVHAVAKGPASMVGDDIVISFYGPKGGSRACEQLSREEAAKLRDRLSKALGPDRVVIDALDTARAFIAEATHIDARWHNEVCDAVNAAIARIEGKQP